MTDEELLKYYGLTTTDIIIHNNSLLNMYNECYELGIVNSKILDTGFILINDRLQKTLT